MIKFSVFIFLCRCFFLTPVLGNFLSDVYHSLSSLGLSTMLTQNHRSKGHLIVDNAGRIAQKQLPVFDPDENFHECLVEEALYGISPDTTVDDISCGKFLSTTQKLMLGLNFMLAYKCKLLFDLHNI